MVYHVCGKFHSEERLGILEHLERFRPGTSALVVTLLPVDGPVDLTPEQFRAQGAGKYGDFVILTDSSQVRSFESTHPL